MDDNDDAPITILNKIVAAIEKHNEILKDQRNAIQKAFQLIEEQNQKLGKLETSNSINPDERRGMLDIAARLTAIANTIGGKS
jgi:UDP-N-acetylmuramyl tripeptide synthase